MKKMADSIRSLDNLTNIKGKLENLYGTMAVIYEGLFTGEMTEESPHCILVMQTVLKEIISMVEEEQQELKKEGHED
nr:hypothetical protein [uncultured Eisenbergiella sp.]